MLDVAHIDRDGFETVGQASWWMHRATDPRDPGEPLFFVIFECSYGHLGTLRHMRSGSGHAICEDGTVVPSVVCPIKGCAFHEHVRLLDWTSNYPAGC